MKTIPIFLLAFFLTACQEEIQSAGEKNAAKVSEQIGLWKVDRMIVFEDRSNGLALVYDGSDFKIEGQFLKAGPSAYWNFEYLKSFELTDSKTIVLRF